MHEIRVYFTHVEVSDYSPGDAPLVERKHMIYDRVYHKGFPKGMYYDEHRRVLMLPRGIDIDKLKWNLGDENTPVYVETRPDPWSKMDRPLSIKYTPRDDKQREAIKFIMGMDHYRYTSEYSMLSVNLNTGVGKTYCAIASLALMQARTIIITDSTNCIEQWYKFFFEYTDIREDEICWISPDNMRRVMALHAKGKRYSVYLMIHATIRAYARAHGWEGVHQLFTDLGIGVKVFDESHLDLDNMFMIDSYTNTRKTLYLTATPNRSDFIEDKIYGEYMRGVPFIDLFEREDAHTMYAAYLFNSNPTPYQISRCMGPYGLNKNAYTNYVIHQKEFHRLMHILVKQAMAKPNKSLWYIGTNNAIRFIYEWLMDNYPELYGDVGMFYGEIPKSERRKQTECKIILSNTKSAGAAVDISGLVETVMLAEPIKSRVLAQQTFGRTRAADTVYKDMVDTGFQQLRKYYNFKKPTFNKYATECREVRIRPDELNDRARKILMDRRSLYTPFFIMDKREGHEGELIGKYRYPFTPADISLDQLQEENVIPEEFKYIL